MGSDRPFNVPQCSPHALVMLRRTAGGQVRRFYVRVPAEATNDMLAVVLAWRAPGESFWLERVDPMLRGCWLSFTVAAIPGHRTSCAFQGAIPPRADFSDGAAKGPKVTQAV